MLQTYHWVCFVLTNSSWAGAWPSMWLIYPVRYSLWDNRFYLSRLLAIAASFSVRGGSCIHVALSVLGPLVCAATVSVSASVCPSCCVCMTVSLGSSAGSPPPPPPLHKSLVKPILQHPFPSHLAGTTLLAIAVTWSTSLSVFCGEVV